MSICANGSVILVFFGCLSYKSVSTLKFIFLIHALVSIPCTGEVQSTSTTTAANSYIARLSSFPAGNYYYYYCCCHSLLFVALPFSLPLSKTKLLRTGFSSWIKYHMSEVLCYSYSDLRLACASKKRESGSSDTSTQTKKSG